MQKGILVSFMALLFAGFAYSQENPNLEAGFKPYGSYHGTAVDTVDMMNGNVTIHIPFPASYPQRGVLHSDMVLILHGKGWQTAPNSQTGGSYWAPARESMGSVDSFHPIHKRTLNSFTASGQTTRSVSNDVVVTMDGATHALMDVSNGAQMAFETVDGSGWHVTMADPDQYGIPQTSIITDRNGTQYTVDKYTTIGDGPCMPSLGGGFSAPGSHPPLQTVNSGGLPSTSEFHCEISGEVIAATDRNGNIISESGTGPIIDTVGRSNVSNPPSFYLGGFTGPVTQSTNPPGCAGTYSFYGSMTIDYPAVNGSQNQILVCYANFTIQTSFGVSGALEYPNSLAGGSGTVELISSIVLPDGSSWIFQYDSYGNVTYLGLPLGGSITYQWTTVAFPSFSATPVSRAIMQRTITDNRGDSYIWKYRWVTSQNNPTSANGTYTNVVTDPLGNDTVHVFTNFLGALAFYETTTSTYQGSYLTGSLLKQVITGYQAGQIAGRGNTGIPVFPNSIQTTVYPSGKVDLIQKTYDAALTDPTAGSATYGKVVAEKVYDWGQGTPGPLLRETDTTYKWQLDSSYLAAHFLDLPATVIIKDGTGCALSESDYKYDEPGYLTASNIATQHVAPPSGTRGNLTTAIKWAAPASSCNPASGASVMSHTNWYDTGEVYQQTDPLGHPTTHSYDPAYVGAYSTETCNALGQCFSGTYDFTTGLLTSFTNANATTQARGNTPGDSAHTTLYSYDLMYRLKSATFPPDPANGAAQAQTTFNYPVPITLPFAVTKTRMVASGLSDSITSTYDGLGRIYKTQQPTSNGTAEVDTEYDGLDQVVSVKNPYFSTADPTYGTTQTQYDALGRPTQITEQDGSLKKVLYDVVPVQAAPGDCTQGTDEAGNQRLTCADALGRLIEVHEPGDNFNGTPASGAINVSGSLKSQPGVGATGAKYATAQVTISGTDHETV
jgi:YD repeat-containing protein